jgi:dsRNA-specific ribonuclease
MQQNRQYNHNPRQNEEDEIMKVTIYDAERGENFRRYIYNILSLGGLKARYIELLLSPANMEIYDKVFTSASADPNNNYENFEIIGDVSINKFLIWYFRRRFSLDSPETVKILSRLKIMYGSKDEFSDIVEKLKFGNLEMFDFIRASLYERNKMKKKLYEDCYEAFIGATELIIDQNIKVGVGYAIVYNILHTIYDTVVISFKYEDLYDPVTRLKEILDKENKNKSDNEKIEFKFFNEPVDFNSITADKPRYQNLAEYRRDISEKEQQGQRLYLERKEKRKMDALWWEVENGKYVFNERADNYLKDYVYLNGRLVTVGYGHKRSQSMFSTKMGASYNILRIFNFKTKIIPAQIYTKLDAKFPVEKQRDHIREIYIKENRS